ncbi:DUF2460 domain-containing protein [Phreatobacter cathodiphilus]|uniref:TIGR02217 family protein n=1 Tax=Phreatobacter cathodiphilus TaxID=1868589 RepID=A0A2S0N808_9HYPH|nr:DUF2460 domain-containing protein [Phreatobacter cathodiphilus]AVO44071.1 TIGR02217 family protein [Phreatobacter cathodiphilus]
MQAFHEVTFPLDVALGASGGPERRTDVVLLGSGREERNARWAHSRRRYDAGYGVKSLAGLQAVVAFFEERRGRLHGFRFRDRLDHASSQPGAAPSPADQPIGTGDGETSGFALAKTYGLGPGAYVRPIAKPVAGTVRVAVAGVETAAFTLDATTGLVTLAAPPPDGAAVTAGFLFDVPVRFDTDRLDVNLTSFAAGEIPSIPLVEIRV